MIVEFWKSDKCICNLNNGVKHNLWPIVSTCNALQAITSSGIKKGEVFLADVSSQLKNKNITTDVKVDTNSNVSLGCFLFHNNFWFIALM